LLAITAIVLAGCETNSQPDPTLVKLNDVDERLGRVEKVVNNQSLLQLSQRIDALEAQLREMRGSVEELQNGNEVLRKQQRDLYADLDRRLTAMQGAAGTAAGTAGSSAGDGRAVLGAVAGAVAGTALGSGGDTSGDQVAYTRAFEALKTNDYSTAITRFKDFLRVYPQSALAGNASYWLGEAYYVTRDFDSAAAAFRAVGDDYPKSPKVPDALLKLGLTQVDQKKLTDAHATLTQVVQRYPGTDAAKLAATKLQNLPPDAH
jgi:tol-pal system protein YbgF